MGKKIDQPVDELLSTEQAAAVAGVSPRTMRRWFDAGWVTGETVPFGSRFFIRVSRSSLEQYLSSENVKPGQPSG